MKYTFHLLGLAHIPTSKAIFSCAYTQKIVNLSKMLTELGHKVILYCTEGSSVPDVEMVTVGSAETRRQVYGNYNWKKSFFKHDPKDLAHQEFNANAIREINARKQERDFLLCPMGNYDKVIADAVNLMTVESGIGYTGVFCDKRVFESAAWMHYMYGRLKFDEGAWWDTVIPNAYDIRDFPYTYAHPSDKEDYYLFVGRNIPLKGLQIAADVTQAIGARLVVAGQTTLNGETGVDLSAYKNVEHVGSVNPKRRFELMSKARAVFVPTHYIGPFEGVNVEAQLCGTPVITTDWGVFQETVQQGVTGFRCRTFKEFIQAAQAWSAIDPNNCRAWAVQHYSTDVIAWKYQTYFDRLYDLWQSGWYQL